MTNEELEKALNVPFTFSKNCASGLLERCECWRCRHQRSEPVTEETEALAAKQSEEAKEAFHQRTLEFLKRCRNDRQVRNPEGNSL